MDKDKIDSAASGIFENVRGELGLPDSIAKRMRIESSMPVKGLDGKPSYWLVPIAAGDRLVGFLRLNIHGELLAYGRFGQGRQLSDFPPFSYLSPETADREIRRVFGDKYEEIIPPQFVHDGPKDRIAWLSKGKSVDGTGNLLFWSFGTTYSRLEDEERDYDLSSGNK